uniref:Trehalase n=1 Tax=Wuchereria bancrofti TaxID=6293 RepID=A0AAF5Q4F9_WUCBA
MVTLIRSVFLSQPSILELDKVIADIESTKQKNMEVCDETDKIANWNIYCSGPILTAMNLHQVEMDSKTFVDRPLKADPDVVLQEFEKEFGKTKVANISAQKLINFRDRFFGEPGTELKDCVIPEWKELPPKIARIKDENLKRFALFLNQRWKDLCRQMTRIENPKQNSLIEVPHPFIVPGGRFREFYYWDAYWIVKGLIVSDLLVMKESQFSLSSTIVVPCDFSFPVIRNNLLNIIFPFRFGFVPNGGRIYYLRRSQPPFLAPMMYEYYEATGDIEFIKENFNHLVKEYEFWVQNRSISVKDEKGYKHNVYQYRTISNRNYIQNLSFYMKSERFEERLLERKCHDEIHQIVIKYHVDRFMKRIDFFFITIKFTYAKDINSLLRYFNRWLRCTIIILFAWDLNSFPIVRCLLQKYDIQTHIKIFRIIRKLSASLLYFLSPSFRQHRFHQTD